MDYQEFKMQMVEELRAMTESDAEIQVRKIPKDNGIVRDGLTILRPGQNVSPTIYLEKYYARAVRGEKPQEIAADILKEHGQFEVKRAVSVDVFKDFSKVRGRLFFRVVNYDLNEERLKGMPHRRVLDLAVVYYFELADCERGQAVVHVRSCDAEGWGVGEEELWETAASNLKEKKPFELCAMNCLIRQLEEEAGEEHDDIPAVPGMYVVTVPGRVYGAACLALPEAFEPVAERVGGDLVVIPSSIHEAIALPVPEGVQKEKIELMIRDINENNLTPDEVLSNRFYYYRAESRELQMA